eukprot:13528294-Alexandrium_andersonii.AAC.1
MACRTWPARSSTTGPILCSRTRDASCKPSEPELPAAASVEPMARTVSATTLCTSSHLPLLPPLPISV